MPLKLVTPLVRSSDRWRKISSTLHNLPVASLLPSARASRSVSCLRRSLRWTSGSVKPCRRKRRAHDDADSRAASRYCADDPRGLAPTGDVAGPAAGEPALIEPVAAGPADTEPARAAPATPEAAPTAAST